MKKMFHPQFVWQATPELPAGLHLYLLHQQVNRGGRGGEGGGGEGRGGGEGEGGGEEEGKRGRGCHGGRELKTDMY